MKQNYLLILFLSLLLAACGSGIDPNEARTVATQAALGTPPPPKYQTAAALFLNLTLTPTPQRLVYGTPTMSMEQFGATMIAQQQSNSQTQQAQDLALEREKLAAEQKREQAIMAALVAEKTSQAIDAQRTAIAQATNQQATAYTNATATQNALIFIQATAAAHSVETQQARSMTAVVEPTHAVWTVTALAYENRIKEGQAREVELAVRRQEMKNAFDAYGPWALVIFVVIVSSEGFRKWLKNRVFKRDEHGKLPVVQTETDNGTKVFTKLDLMPTPVLSIDKDANIDLPKPPDPEEQSDVTRRTQAIEAISFLPTPYAQQGPKLMNAEFGKGGTPNIFIRNNPALTPVLDEADAQFMEENHD